jgi:hypothetical protein
MTHCERSRADALEAVLSLPDYSRRLWRPRSGGHPGARKWIGVRDHRQRRCTWDAALYERARVDFIERGRGLERRCGDDRRLFEHGNRGGHRW